MTRMPAPQRRTLVEFDYADPAGEHLSEVVWTTDAQRATLRRILARAEAAEVIRPGWYVDDPQREPTPFEDFLPQLRYALRPELVDEA